MPCVRTCSVLRWRIMMTKITERMIRAMPYEVRLQHYNQEKDEMFRKNAGVSARELQRLHEELIKKWKV